MFFIVAMIIWSIARHTIVSLVYKLLKCICIGICGKKEEDVFAEEGQETEELRSRDIYRDLDLHFLTELLDKAEKELTDFENEPANSVSYDQDFRYPEEATFESTAIMDKLEFRVQQIKKIIEDHLAALHGRAQLGAFQQLNHRSKLAYLIKKAGVIERLDGRTRMDGITQSYNIDDS